MLTCTLGYMCLCGHMVQNTTTPAPHTTTTTSHHRLKWCHQKLCCTIWHSSWIELSANMHIWVYVFVWAQDIDTPTPPTNTTSHHRLKRCHQKPCCAIWHSPWIELSVTIHVGIYVFVWAHDTDTPTPPTNTTSHHRLKRCHQKPCCAIWHSSWDSVKC